MKKSTAKLLTGWIPSVRYRRAVRRALCDVPSNGPVVKRPYEEMRGDAYQTLVVPRGFGHSGSGVIGDLLSEYEGVTVFGGADPDGSGRFAGIGKVNAGSFELDIFKMYGGVANLAAAFGEMRPWGKFLLLNFVHVVESLYRETNIPFYDRRFLERSRRFVSDLTESSWRSVTPMAENHFFEMPIPPPENDALLLNPLYSMRENLGESYVMKNLSQDEYIELARDYLGDILKNVPSEKVLVMDQLLSVDLPLDMCARYIGPFKMIAVYRDPRDVYCTGLMHGIPWIPSEKTAFVSWFRHLGIGDLKKECRPDLEVLRFEDLVLDYEKSVHRIEHFVGLDPSAHLRPKAAFDPQRSLRNIALWRNCPDQSAIAYIAENLRAYCYQSEKEHVGA